MELDQTTTPSKNKIRTQLFLQLKNQFQLFLSNVQQTIVMITTSGWKKSLANQKKPAAFVRDWLNRSPQSGDPVTWGSEYRLLLGISFWNDWFHVCFHWSWRRGSSSVSYGSFGHEKSSWRGKDLVQRIFTSNVSFSDVLVLKKFAEKWQGPADKKLRWILFLSVLQRESIYSLLHQNVRAIELFPLCYLPEGPCHQIQASTKTHSRISLVLIFKMSKIADIVFPCAHVSSSMLLFPRRVGPAAS